MHHFYARPDYRRHEGGEVTDLAERPAVRTAPDIRVPLPGPKARKHVEYKETKIK